MRDIAFEEGEAYFFQDDDDENIDPDRDFSYIDKKIEDVLGHFQKDFMGGLSAEKLGARFGGYGSFLPMQQRSPPILSNPTTQNHISSNSPQNPKSPQNPSTNRFSQNTGSAVNHSLPARPGVSSNDGSVQAPSEAGLPGTNEQSKLQSSGDFSFIDQQTEPLVHHADQLSLKFRVKITSEDVPSHDNSAIYSGLGLDMSPCSSPDDSPAEYDRTSPGMEESKEDSLSSIVKIMTSSPLSNDVLLSPLNDSLMSLLLWENKTESGKPGSSQELSASSIHGSTYSEAKRETEGRNSRFDSISKERKSKQKESRKDGKSQQKVQSTEVSEFVQENKECPVTACDLPANKCEVTEMSVAKAVIAKISNNTADEAALKDNSSGSKPLIMLYTKNDTEHLEEVSFKSMKQDGANVKDKSMGEFVSVPSPDVGMGGEGNVNSSGGKIYKDKNTISNPKRDLSGSRNEVGCKEVEKNKSLKQQTEAKERVKEAVLNTVYGKEDDDQRKEIVIREKIPKVAKVGFLSTKDAKENDKHFVVSLDGKDPNVETIELPKKKSHPKAIANPQMGTGFSTGREHLFTVMKKKSKEGRGYGVSVAEPPINVLSKIKMGDTDLPKEMRKDICSISNACPGRKGKEVNSRDSMVEILDVEMQLLNGKMKSTNEKMGIASDIGSHIGRDVAGGTTVMEKASAAGVLPTENALSIVMDDWVMCEKCEKWRLLPFGRNPDLLPKKWICKMLDWLPGMNKCSITEEETTNALYAMYQLQVPASLMQKNQQVHPDGSAPGPAATAARPVSLPIQAAENDTMPSGGNKRDSMKTEMSAGGQSSFPGFGIPVKKEQHSGEHRNSKILKNHPPESDAVARNGDTKSSKHAKKRVAHIEESGTPKKMKRQSMEKSVPVGLLPVEVKSEGKNCNPGALRFSEHFAKRFSEFPPMKAQSWNQDALVARVNEKKDVPGKKRKMEEQRKSVVPTEEPAAKGAMVRKGNMEHRKEKKEKKSKVSNFQSRECIVDKCNGRIHSGAGENNIAAGSDNNLANGSRMNDLPLDKHHAERAFQRTVDSRKSSEKVQDLGLENATTSSLSKIPYKGKPKGHDVKCSPVGSLSFSPMRVCKTEPGRVVNKTSLSHEGHEELFSAMRLKSRAEGSSNEVAVHNEEMRVRKSNLSKASGIVVEASDDDGSAKKMSTGRRPSVRRIDAHPKADKSYEEGILTSRQNFVSENRGAGTLNRSYVDETNSRIGKLCVSDVSVKKEPSYHSQSSLKSEEGNGPNFIRVDKISLRHPEPTRPLSTDMGASSSIADNFYKAAKTALKEAMDLKHSASHLKKSGSGLESTRVFFQAALKFLHGASLLEPDDSESVRCGEMSPSDVYSTTARLCDYCAREYERFNDMASASLAYKCMEVAYMRVVYYNDVAACRDRRMLHMAIRAAPQAESPSSSASDVDNLNNQAATDSLRNGNSSMEHRNHIISAGNRPNFMRLLDFTKDINLAMEASRRSQDAFAAANPVLTQAGNEECLSCIKRVLDFSFHDVDGLLHLVGLAMDALNN